MAQNITEIIRAIAEQSMPHIVIGYIQTVEPLEVILIDDININVFQLLHEFCINFQRGICKHCCHRCFKILYFFLHRISHCLWRGA